MSSCTRSAPAGNHHYHLFYRQPGGDDHRHYRRAADGRIAANCRVYLPKSVTTPIAMAVGGSRRHSGHQRRVRHFRRYSRRGIWPHPAECDAYSHQGRAGLSMGTASHALGTARCAELDYQEGAFSSLALVICGIITSLMAPFLFPLILAVVGKICDASHIFHLIS
jgi:hypothetical protein